MESWDQEALCKLCLKPSKVVKMTACYTLVPEENGTASAGSKQAMLYKGNTGYCKCIPGQAHGGLGADSQGLYGGEGWSLRF